MGKAYKRVLLKLSGEAIAGEKGFGIDPKVVNKLTNQIAKAKKQDVEIAIVCLLYTSPSPRDS